MFATASPPQMIFCLSLFLLGSAGLTVSLNMLVTQSTKIADWVKDKAFFWLYMSLNIGYLIGYFLSGYYGNNNEYQRIPMIIFIGAAITIALCFFNWKKINVSAATLNKYANYYFLLIISLLFAVIDFLLQFPVMSNLLIISSWGLLSLWMFFLWRKDNRQKEAIIFYILLVSAVIFWSLYFLAPMALMIFIKYYVNLNILGYSIAPQWIQNINTLVIIGGTLYLGSKASRKAITIQEIVKQFSVGLFLLGTGFFVLGMGIYLVHSDKVALSWIVLSYVLQSFGELLIGPISYALIGRLVPRSYQSIMMGIWITLLGVASSISSLLSNMLPYSATKIHLELTSYIHFFAVISFFVIAFSSIVYLISCERFFWKLRY